jgi:acetylornithine deacetylase/succinyl-diaminopimelate desuccinylase-like protein
MNPTQPHALPRCSLRILATLLATVTLWTSATQARQQTGLEVARAYRQASGSRIVRDFADLLAIPNVAVDSIGIHRNAEYIRQQLENVGVHTELWSLPGVPPIVYGELHPSGGAASRTLGVYVHYDGQPVDTSSWTHGPWTPTLYTRPMEEGGVVRALPTDGETVDPEWRLYARSAGDDKAPIGALIPVLRAFMTSDVTPTSNVKFFFEGEEEAGSTRLRSYLEAHRAQLDDIDIWLFFDGPVHQSRRPLLTYGVRGVTSLDITVFGATRSLHSGHYGNWAPVPGQMLAHLLASMKDETGRVLIDGFYDTVEPLGAAERDALARLPNTDDDLRRELGLAWTEGSGESLAERLLLPSLTVKGLRSANVGAQARNVIPSTATASLGIRLVKGNDPEAMLDLVEAHISRQGYHIVRTEPDMDTRLRYPKIAMVTRGSGYPAARTDMSIPIVQQVTAAATRAADGDMVLAPALGGSLPLYLFTDVMGKPAIIVPVANHDDNQHAPNENLRIANLWYAIDLYAALLTMPPEAVP